MVLMILPLLKKQKYIKSVNFFKNQKIDIDLNLFRKIPMNFNLDEVRWYFYLTGVHTNLTRPYLSANMHKHLKNKIVIMRSTRRKNEFINYKFMNKYKNILLTKPYSKQAIKNSEGMLLAASKRSVYNSPRGPVYPDDKMAEKVLTNLDQIFVRIQKLINPVWQ